jgi:glycosyltransferase involved in cell wall biosynthesis
MTRRFHYVGSYDQWYPRHRIIQKGLRELGYQVTESQDRAFLPLRWVRLCVALIGLPRAVPVIVGEASNYLTPVIVFARLQRRKVVFDSFVSLQEIHGDYHKGVSGRLWSLVGGVLDRINCLFATTVIVDTKADRRYFVDVLGVPSRKVHVVYVGAETDLFVARSRRPTYPSGELSILFFGSFLPLHGIETILRAAALLQEEPKVKVHFTLVGAGHEYQQMRLMAARLSLANVSFGPTDVPYERLPDLIYASDACLGIFGATSQAQRVVPNKVFQAAACARPVVTADTPAIREVFSAESALLVPAADPGALADALRRLAASEEERRALSERGASLVQSSYGNVSIARQLLASQVNQ